MKQNLLFYELPHLHGLVISQLPIMMVFSLYQDTTNKIRTSILLVVYKCAHSLAKFDKAY